MICVYWIKTSLTFRNKIKILSYIPEAIFCARGYRTAVSLCDVNKS